MNWCILRTAGRSTIALAQSLAADGFETWTPIETRMVRVPRANVRRPVSQPIMPSYVFARASHLIDLIQMSKLPVKPRRGRGLRDPAHASFSVMRCGDRIPIIDDRDLATLRRIEARRLKPKEAERPLPTGARARVKEGSFGGLTGIVERSDTKATLVCFNGKYVVKIATSLLLLDEIYRLHPATGIAAQDAAAGG